MVRLRLSILIVSSVYSRVKRVRRMMKRGCLVC